MVVEKYGIEGAPNVIAQTNDGTAYPSSVATIVLHAVVCRRLTMILRPMARTYMFRVVGTSSLDILVPA